MSTNQLSTAMDIQLSQRGNSLVENASKTSNTVSNEMNAIDKKITHELLNKEK